MKSDSCSALLCKEWLPDSTLLSQRMAPPKTQKLINRNMRRYRIRRQIVTSNMHRRYGADIDNTQETKKKCSLFVAFIAVACTVLAGIGDWKVLNNAYGGLPKAIALGTIVCAFLNFLVDADFTRIKKAVRYFPTFLLLIAVYVLISMYIWVTDFSKAASISRAGQKIFFQTVTIIYAVFMCYL